VIASKAANGYQFKTGQRKQPSRTKLLCLVTSCGGKSVFARRFAARGNLKARPIATSGLLDDTSPANPDNNFRYDATLGTTGGYIFNLSTGGLATGTYQLTFLAGADPTIHSVLFQVE
jgi:hypothetical protein